MNLGATVKGKGVRFAVFSANATAIDLCLFDPDETRLAMEPEGDIWHIDVPGIGAGAQYGFRAQGPAGGWFNHDKLLLDPYAKALTAPLRWSEAMQGDDPRDSADVLPRCIVTEDAPAEWRRPETPWIETVLYEAHAKGVTAQHPDLRKRVRGRFRGLASSSMISHLKRLGVTAVELLPVQAFIDDRFLATRGLTNYWGYQTLGFFAPDPRYGTADEFRAMVRRFHGAGIEVILDVVYNHSGEGDETGPTVAFRGLDNSSYYRLSGNEYLNDAGTGNTLDLTHPMVLRMVMDSLRHWVQVMGVDGFRFDLATVLAREAAGFDAGSGFLDALRQDPVLREVKLIAEPWDLGPGGYRLGEFPPPFAEWNDRFRDDVRRVWRGEAQMPELAKRLLGSAERFDHDRREAHVSINFLTAHDGFTLMDLVSYDNRHNLANGEDNRDGHGDNLSNNMGTEGPDPELEAARALRRRNLLATMFLSQGTPMLLAGDEMGNSQDGNNNAYGQDNPIGWVQWQDDPMIAFVARLAALRRDHPVLRQPRFLHAEVVGDYPNVIWRRADGQVPAPQDWPTLTSLGLELRAEGQRAVYIFINPLDAVPLTLPDTAGWTLLLDTTRPDADTLDFGVEAPADSVLVFGQN